MSDDRLTILLTIKGRPEFTLRWLWHAHKIKFPYKVYIADGEVNESLAAALESGKHFTNVNYRYVRYSDTSFLDYYQKCADAVSNIDTNYVMMSDNDDFLFVTGIQRSLDFLDSNPDFVCSQGVVSGFGVKSSPIQLDKVEGRINRLQCVYSKSYTSRSIVYDEPLKRVQDQMNNYHTTYYSLTRRVALAKITSELVDLNFTSLELHELYWAFREAALGKVHSVNNHLFYFRQRQTSLRKPQDWVDGFLNSNYSPEVNLMLRWLSESLSSDSFVNLKENFAKYLRAKLLHQYKARDLSFAKRVKRKFENKYDPTGRKKFVKNIKKNIISSELFLRELAEIESTLSDMELSRFIRNTLKM